MNDLQISDEGKSGDLRGLKIEKMVFRKFNNIITEYILF